MQAPTSPKVGLPPGVEPGGLGKRLAAHVIDSLVPGVAFTILGYAVFGLVPGTARTGISIVAVLASIGWAVLVWWMFATKAAGPGMRLMKLQLVGFRDGRPIGWVRFLLRQLVLFALTLTGVGLVILVVLLVRHPRRQGLHDLVADSVVIKERVLAPRLTGRVPTVGQRPVPRAVPVQPSLTPHQLSVPAEQNAAAPIPGPQQNQDRRSDAPQPAASSGDASARPRVVPSRAPRVQPPMVAEPAPDPASGPEHPDPPAAPAEEDPVPVERVVPQATPPAELVGGRLLDEGWGIALADGREIAVEGLVLVGRNPKAGPGEEDAILVKLPDESRTVSKTHLAVGVDANGIFIVDRGSTNGSTVTDQHGESTRCPPGDVVTVTDGQVVSFGDQWLKIIRS